MNNLNYIDIKHADVRVIYAHTCRCHPAWRWNSLENGWDGTLIWYVLSGRGQMKTPYGEYTLHAGVCFCIPMDEEFIGSHNPEDPIRVIAIHVQSRALQKKLPRHCIIHRPETLRVPMQQALANWEKRQQDMANFWVRATILVLAEETSDSAPHHPQRFHSICARIRQEPGAPYDLSVLASTHGYSKDHFIRLFKEETGITPTQYIIAARMEKARELLLLSSTSVGDISAMLGYQDPYFFSRQFRQHMGISPRSYRQSVGP